jgi:hypothetical protein
MKPQMPLFPDAALHPTTPYQQLRPMLEAYRNQVHAFYDSLKLYTLDGFDHWGTPAVPSHISDSDLELELAKLSPAARARLETKP